MEKCNQSTLAAQAAVDAHTKALGIEGGLQVQLWHLLLSLHELCGANGIDFDSELASAKTAIASGEVPLPAWESFVQRQTKEAVALRS